MKDERSRRQAETGQDTVTIIDPTPRVDNEVLELAFFVSDEQGMIVDGSDIAEAIILNENDLLAAVSINTYLMHVGDCLNTIISQ